MNAWGFERGFKPLLSIFDGILRPMGDPWWPLGALLGPSRGPQKASLGPKAQV